MNLFDYAEGQNRKREGMELASDNRESLLELARRVALELSVSKPELTADDVGEHLATHYGIESLGPAAGSLFKGGGWEFTGRRIVSKRTRNHGRELKVWRRKRI